MEGGLYLCGWGKNFWLCAPHSLVNVPHPSLCKEASTMKSLVPQGGLRWNCSLVCGWGHIRKEWTCYVSLGKEFSQHNSNLHNSIVVVQAVPESV